MTPDIEKLTLVDCGTVRLRGLGERRAVYLNGSYYMWDQDALDRKLGLGKYLFRRPKFDFEIDVRRYRKREPQTDDMRQMVEALRSLSSERREGP